MGNKCRRRLIVLGVTLAALAETANSYRVHRVNDSRFDVDYPRPVDNKLRAAVENGDYDRVVRLLDAGASPDSVEEADCEGDDRIACLSVAAFNGDVRMMRLLLIRGAHIDAPSKWGGTALWFAAARYHPDAVRFLVANGANVNPSNYGTTAVGAAARESWADPETQSRQRETIKVLRDSGADRWSLSFWNLVEHTVQDARLPD